MKAEIKIPAMGESIVQATIGTILKPSGSYVEADEEIIELETEKVNQVLHAPEKGILTLSVKEGDVVKIGQVIGDIDTSAKVPEAGTISKEKVIAEEKAPKKVEGSSGKESARFTTEDLIAELKGGDKDSGKEKVQELKPPEKKSQKTEIGSSQETRKKMSSIRKVIAKRLVEAQQTSAMLTTFNEVDMSTIISLREKYKETFLKEHQVKLGFMSFFIKASVEALEDYPDFNSFIENDEIVTRHYYNINVAVSTDKGVFVPVIKDCDLLSFAEIEKQLEQLAKRAREGTLTPQDLTGGGFTITNGGVFGSLLSTPILNPPQAGILGMHKIEKRPVVIQEEISIRPMMYLALSYDHRIVDGKEAVSFLVAIKNYLEDPSRLLLEIKD